MDSPKKAFSTCQWRLACQEKAAERTAASAKARIVPALEREVNELVCMAGIQLEDQEDFRAERGEGKEKGVGVASAADAEPFGEKDEHRER